MLRKALALGQILWHTWLTGPLCTFSFSSEVLGADKRDRMSNCMYWVGWIVPTTSENSVKLVVVFVYAIKLSIELATIIGYLSVASIVASHILVLALFHRQSTTPLMHWKTSQLEAMWIQTMLHCMLITINLPHLKDGYGFFGLRN